MPRKASAVPSYLHHKPTGQAFVALKNPEGGRRFVYLGVYGSPESKAEYARIVSELRVSPDVARAGSVDGITVNELLLAFLRHAEQHYRRADGTHTNELAEFKVVARSLRERYGHTPAASFGPLALKAVRSVWVESKLSRGVINARVGRRLFKWAAGEELIPFEAYQKLTTVTGLQKGRSDAKETEPIRPVRVADVEATIPYLSPTVRAMVEVQSLAGMRPHT